MSDIMIQQYYSELEKLIQYGGSHNETAIRNAFYALLNRYCAAAAEPLLRCQKFCGRAGA